MRLFEIFSRNSAQEDASESAPQEQVSRSETSQELNLPLVGARRRELESEARRLLRALNLLEDSVAEIEYDRH